MSTVVSPRRRRWGRWALLAYLAALAASHVVRRSAGDEPVPEQRQVSYVSPVRGHQTLPGTVRLSYLEWGMGTAGRPVVVLLHGSPGSAGVMAGLGDLLGNEYRVIAPDLPGFGSSTGSIPDYSVAAHASYVLQLLDTLGIDQAHVVGFSLGGGVALEMADTAPDRVRSLTLLSSIGVQELELLGDYHLNHAIHGLQLGALWFLYEAVPHFGTLDQNWLNVAYARNFYDTDQRPLRGILERYQGPMLILHGEHDPLVPSAAAREHHRIVPQAEMVMYHDGHFMTFMRPGILADPLVAFIDGVEDGTAIVRAGADPARVAAAESPFDPSTVPPKTGFSLFVVLALISLATLVSEDLATISAGLMVARGSITFLQGTAAAFIGIFVGDVLLFLVGRFLGAPVLARAPLKWFVRAADVERSRVWFRHQGPWLVLLSRFVPGTRLPTYVAAGALRMNLLTFAFWFLLASMLWTPALVALSMVFGAELSRLLGPDAPAVWPWLLGVGLFVVALRLLLKLATYRGRRLLLSRWRRITEWEFWPVWLFYIPVVLYIVYLGIKHRCLTLFTAANPALPDGGFAGESKAAMLRGLPPEVIARFDLVPATLSPEERSARARAFMEREHLTFPIVVKPDVGERGDGVAIVHDSTELDAHMVATDRDLLVQEYVPGVEIGVFYYRMPGEGAGRIFGVTEKRLQSVTGDGVTPLETLILRDDRAMRQAPLFLRRHCRQLLDVPPAGKSILLGELGNHCQGAVFLDGRRYITADLEAAIDRISRAYQGFYIGRYDVRAPSEEDLLRGRAMTVLELNGVSSEATNIYDPSNRLRQAYATLFEQWRIAFAIAAANQRAGTSPMSLPAFLKLIWRHLTRRSRRETTPPAGTSLDPATLVQERSGQ